MSKRETAIVGLALLATSGLLYLLHYALFRDAVRTLTCILEFTAFLPIEVLVLTLVVDRLLAEREKGARRDKMNMVIGAFFTEVGIDLLRLLPRMVADPRALADRLAVAPDWDADRLRGALSFARKAEFEVEATPAGLKALRDRLSASREFALRLLENPVLLEHEQFTDLLWAVSHLTDELMARRALDGLPPADAGHLASDAKRAYSRLVAQWLAYMMHLQRDYPYLYSFAARTNPLRLDAQAEVV